MNEEKIEYESPKFYVTIIKHEDVITTSNPDFDGGQSGLSLSSID